MRISRELYELEDKIFYQNNPLITAIPFHGFDSTYRKKYANTSKLKEIAGCTFYQRNCIFDAYFL